MNTMCNKARNRPYVWIWNRENIA